MEKSPSTLYDLIAAPERLPQEVGLPDQAPEIRKLFTELQAKFAEGTVDPLDLEQDIVLMRAIVINYINRWDDFSNALIGWYYDKRGHAPERLLDLSQAAVMLEQVSRVAERLHKMRQTTAINLAVLREMMDQMAMVVAKHVSDPALLAAISEDWDKIDIDLKAKG